MFRPTFRRLAALFLVSTLLLVGLRVRSGQAFVVMGAPIWGVKPVLHYFVTTASLAEKLGKAGLSPDQLQIVRQVGLQEADELEQLFRSSQLIAQAESLSLAEKRARIQDSGYNQQVQARLLETSQALQAALDAPTYERLVDWIERQWQAERLLHGLSSFSTVPASPSTARTYSIYATRFDSDAAPTVALPDQCLKHANNGLHLCDDSGYAVGQNYSVRLHYQDTKTVEVSESGPWNVDDSYWADLNDPQPRRLFPDLPAGMPEAQAAFYDDYNNGEDQFGREVIAPFGIDLTDDVSVDIGLPVGVNDWIDVTFLWTDGWENQQAEVVTLYAPSQLEPPYSGDMCGSAWHRITGYGGYAYLTLNVDSAAQSTNSGEWQPNLPSSGRYQVLAYVPDHPPIDWQCPTIADLVDTSQARYTIQHAGGETTVSGNQRPLINMWLDLGSYDFDSGTGGKVTLSDLNGETSLTHTIAFSAMQFRKELPDVPDPTPTPPPAPTPTPGPYIWSGSGRAAPGEEVTVPLAARNLRTPGLGSASLDLQFDPAVVSLVSCQANPGFVFTGASCTLDAVYTDTLHLQLSSSTGVTGDPLLASLTFQALGDPGQFSALDVLVQALEDPSGVILDYPAYGSLVCVKPCLNLVYLPVVGK